MGSLKYVPYILKLFEVKQTREIQTHFYFSIFYFFTFWEKSVACTLSFSDLFETLLLLLNSHVKM